MSARRDVQRRPRCRIAAPVADRPVRRLRPPAQSVYSRDQMQNGRCGVAAGTGRKRHDKADQAFGASQLSWARRCRERLARPYIANAAAKTAEVWWAQGFVPGRGHRVQEDRRRLREGQRQHDRAQHHAVRAAAPEDRLGGDERRRPGPVSPTTRPRSSRCYAWDDKLVDVTDVVETQKEEYTETALLNTYCYNSVTKKRSFYGVPYTTRRIAEPCLAAAGREGRLQDGGHPEDLGCLLRFLQGRAEEIARPGRCATSTASVST